MCAQPVIHLLSRAGANNALCAVAIWSELVQLRKNVALFRRQPHADRRGQRFLVRLFAQDPLSLASTVSSDNT